MSTPAKKYKGDVNQLIDQVLETGKPAEITRNGKTLRLVVVNESPSVLTEKTGKINRFKATECSVLGDVEFLLD